MIRLAALGVASISLPGHAQEAPSAEVGQIDEVIVTARRQNESLRDVPATISVLTSRDIENTGVKIASDFLNLTPGVSIATGTTEPGDTSINIRGLNGSRDAENNVALVIDGVLRTSVAALNQVQGALSQIEVLKGPQGAIYGRNASAGAIVITTRKPTDTLEAEAKASIGNHNTDSASLLVSGPITPVLGFVANIDWGKSNGTWTNSFLGTPLAGQVYPTYNGSPNSIDDYDRGNAFVRLIYTPSENTEVDLKMHYGYNDSGAISYNAAFQLPSLVTAFNDPVFNEDISNHKFVFTNNTAGQSWQRTKDASIHVTQKLNNTSLIGTLSYSDISDDYIAGGTSGAFGFFDGAPSCIGTRAATAGVANQEPFHTYYDAFGFAQPYSPSTCDGIQYQRRTQEDVTAELRWVSDSTGPLTWQVGGSYIYIDRRTCINLSLDTGLGGQRVCYTTDPRFHTEELQDDTYITNVFAGFGSVDWKATDQLRFGGALRYDVEARRTANNIPLQGRTLYVGNVLTGHPDGTPAAPADYYLNAGLDPAYNATGAFAPRTATFKSPEPKLTATWEPTSSLTVFGDWGLGFKAGGFNSAGSAAIVDAFFNPPVAAGGIAAGVTIGDEYKKEIDSAFEVGLKGRVSDRFDYQLVGYYTRVKDMQFFEFFVGPFGQLRVVSNIDRVRISGGEASGTFHITRNWTVFSSGNYTASRIEKNSSRPYTVGNKSPGTPDFTVDSGTQFQMPINKDFGLMFRLDERTVGHTPFHTVQNNTVPTIFGADANFENSIRRTYTTVNARAGVQGEHWSVTAYATNLLNKHYLEESVNAPEFGGDFVAPGVLRLFGVEVGVKF